MNDLFGEDEEDCEITDHIDECEGTRAYCEVRACENVGGNRGVFANFDLSAGCLLSAEKSFLSWDHTLDFSDVDDLATIILEIIRSPDSLACTKALFPSTVADCVESDCDHIKQLFQSYDANDLSLLAEEAQTSTEEIVRIALTLQHNGFSSGLYEKQCMFNHSCAPNCIKLTPPGKHSPSEIWTTRPILAGDELVICYYNPVESSSSTVRSYLRSNHRFACKCSTCSVLANTGCEIGLDEAEPLTVEQSIELNFEQQIIIAENAALDLQEQRFSLETVELMSLAYAALRLQLDEYDVSMVVYTPLLARLCKAVIAAAVACIEVSELHHLPVKEDDAVAFLKDTVQLLGYQRIYLGSEHPDVGSTFLDIAEGIDSLKKQFPGSLSKRFLVADWDAILLQPVSATAGVSSPSSFSACSKYCRGEAKRLRSLYSTAAKYPAAMKLLTAKEGSYFWGFSTVTTASATVDKAAMRG